MDNSQFGHSSNSSNGNIDNHHKDYDNNYPPLESDDNTIHNSIDFPIPQEVTNNQTTKKMISTGTNNCNVETRMIKFPSKNVPKNNSEKFFSELKVKLSEMNSQISLTKLPCGSYNILIKAPREKLSDAVALVERELQPKITTKIRLESRRFSMLTAKSYELAKEILYDVANNVQLSSQPNNILVLTGLACDVNQASRSINKYIDKMSKSEALTIDDIPQKFHPFVRGAFNCNITRIMAECDNCVSIDVPSPNSNNRIITITGPEEHRQTVRSELMRIYNTVRKNSTMKTFKFPVELHVNIKRACGLDKILKETNVAVSLPYEGQVSSDSVIFVGNSKDIPNAFHLALARARVYKYSEIPCKKWVLKILQQKPSFSFADMKNSYPHTWISYLSSKECIVLDGPIDNVNAIEEHYHNQIEDITMNMTFTSIKVPVVYESYLKDAGIKIVNRICDATNTKIDFNDVPTSGNTTNEKPLESQLMSITIFGKDHDIHEASKLFEEFITQLNELTSAEIELDSLLLPYINAECSTNSFNDDLKNKFGSSLRIAIKTLKTKRISFVTLQGKKGIVFSAKKFIEDIIEQISNDVIIHEVDIPPAYHYLIVGKKGATKDEIIESSGIDKLILPSNNNSTDATSSSVITLVGSPKACKLAEILMIEKCNMNVELDRIDIKFGKSFVEKLKIGDGIIMRRIVANCLGSSVIVEDNSKSNIVNVYLPSGELQSKNNVCVQGYKSYAKLVADKLIELEKKNLLFVELLRIDDDMIRSVIGKGGAQIKKFSEDSSVEIIVRSSNMRTRKTNVPPSPHRKTNDNDNVSENVFLMGSVQSDVTNTKNQIVKYVKELKDIIEMSVNVPKKYIKKFFTKKADTESLLSQLNSKYPSVRIIVPKDVDGIDDKDENDRSMVLKGPSKMVTNIYADIIALIQKWDITVRVEFTIQYDHANMLRNNEIPNFVSIAKEYDVIIKSFREGDKGTKPTSETLVNVVLEGIDKAVVSAKEKILNCGPVTEIFVAPRQYHRSLIGAKGSELKKIVDGYNVTITFPESDSHSNDIHVRGPKQLLAPVLERLKKSLDSIIAKQIEWEKNNHIIEMTIDPKWFSKIIGRGGKQIKALKKQLNVSINIPKIDTDSELSNKPYHMNINSTDNMDGTKIVENITPSTASYEPKIVLRGEKKYCEEAYEKIKSKIDEWENTVMGELHVPKSIHGKIRGYKSANIMKVQKKYKVEIHFASIDDETDDTIKVLGQPENVKNAIEHIKEMVAQLIVEVDDGDDDQNYRIPSNIDSWENFQFTVVNKQAEMSTDELSHTSLSHKHTSVDSNDGVLANYPEDEMINQQYFEQAIKLQQDSIVEESKTFSHNIEPPMENKPDE